VLLAITFFPKRVLAPATEKGDGVTGVLLETGDGKRKVFHQECENHWQSVMATRVATTKWWQLEHFHGCQPLERYRLKRLPPATYLKMLWHSN
jgi:hypothetical protein